SPRPPEQPSPAVPPPSSSRVSGSGTKWRIITPNPEGPSQVRREKPQGSTHGPSSPLRLATRSIPWREDAPNGADGRARDIPCPEGIPGFYADRRRPSRRGADR